MRVMIALLVFASVSMAGPITYYVEAQSNAAGDTFTGSITWESSSVTTNADLTLESALDWTFTWTPSGEAGRTFSDSDPHQYHIDRPLLIGTFGVTDLTADLEHDWTVNDHDTRPATDRNWYTLFQDNLGGSEKLIWLAQTTGLTPTSGDLISPYPASPPAWKLTLTPPTAPVPEPGTLVLFGVAALGAYVYRRRRRAA